MNTEPEQSVKKKVGLTTARALVFGLIYLGVYVLLLLLPISFADNYGFLRAFITATMSKITEVVIFEVVRRVDA